MQHYKLKFHGYTWDDYFYVISTKKGVLVTYKGSLDSEGTVQLDEILYIEGADHISDIYDSNSLKEIRSSINNGEKLFFSYAETDKYQEVTLFLINKIRPRFNKKIDKALDFSLSWEGSCALFPDYFK